MSGRRGPGRLLRALPLLFLVVGLALPAAVAAPPLRLEAPVVTAEGADVRGPLVAAAAFVADFDRAGGTGSLTLTASQVHLEVDRSERPLVVDASGTGLGALPANETAESMDLLDVVFSGAGSDHSARLLVWPLVPGAAGLDAAGTVKATAASGEATPFTAVSGARGAHLLPGSGVALVAGHGGVELRGDLRIAATGLSFAGTADGRPLTLDTRRSDEELTPGLAGLSTRRTVAWEAVAELHGAVLRLPAATLLAAELDLEAPAIAFDRAAGTLFGVAADGDDAVAATGRLAAHLVPAADDRLAATLDGRWTSLHVGAAAVDLPRGGPGSPWLALGLLPAALAAHIVLGRLRFRRLDRAVREGRYADALRLAGRFRLHPSLAQDALLAEGLSLTELGRAADARTRLLGRATWSPARQGMRDFLLARAAARAGDLAEATRRLAASLLADPALRPQAVADPALDAIVGSRSRAAADGPAQEAYA